MLRNSREMENSKERRKGSLTSNHPITCMHLMLDQVGTWWAELNLGQAKR
jgi:hypothetical protein